MPKNHVLLKTDGQILNWIADRRFEGDLTAARKFLSNWRHQWNKNGNRYKAGDPIFEDHKKNVLNYLKKGATIAKIKSHFKISINHIKRILSELTSEKKIFRLRDGKAFIYLNNTCKDKAAVKKILKRKLRSAKNARRSKDKKL